MDKDEKLLSSGAEYFLSPASHDVRTVLSWSAPGRPWKRRSKQFYTTGLLLATLIEVILFLFSQYLLMLLVISLVFVGFSFSLVPPKNFHYRISNQGLMIEDHFFIWDELYDFYFRRHEGIDTLYVRTVAFLPGALIISLGDMHKDQIKQALLPYLPYREVVHPTFMERSGDWIYKNFPLEKAA